MKRNLAFLLALALTVAAIPAGTPAYAAEAEEELAVGAMEEEEPEEVTEPADETDEEENTETVTQTPQDQSSDVTTEPSTDSSEEPGQTTDPAIVPGTETEDPADPSTDDNTEVVPDSGQSTEIIDEELVDPNAPDYDEDGELVADSDFYEEDDDVVDGEITDEFGAKKKVGFIYEKGAWHYYKKDGKQLISGWLVIKKSRTAKNSGKTLSVKKGSHFFNKKGDHVVSNYAYTSDKGIQYFDGNGLNISGWIKYAGSWHYYDSKKGRLDNAWKTTKKISVKDQSGKSATIYKGDHYFDNKGRMVTSGNIKTKNKGWQYFNGNGVNVTGWIYHNKTWHYYTEDKGMLVSTWKTYTKKHTLKCPVSKQTYTLKKGEHYFTDKGELAINTHVKTNRGIQYFDKNGLALSGWVYYADAWHLFDEKDGAQISRRPSRRRLLSRTQSPASPPPSTRASITSTRTAPWS